MFKFPILFSLACILAAGYYGAYSPMGALPAILTVVLLGILEPSLSVDNAVVNAKVVAGMSPRLAWALVRYL